ncbi:MAG: type 4a pilus biogenesis protein PilO [Candidatus Omnitrophica bacterium]|nr:type 4a pilus biogenesis protein PilO [Candidatus Omnitrophota bacterium]MCA9416089.1 type 4a pilus biogenesis protein PilO [Candidatus Omnitrophota bacterium]MCA9441585.1 type 4a pilus biogenesis protein PilO [Candidatus Omnitrophota bacterium]MCB9769498.1 type 4a pilus biogenesis protein PilO [Candidatus Omnitrophota bacterium]
MPLSTEDKQQVQQVGILCVLAILALILAPAADYGIGIMRIREAIQGAEKKLSAAEAKFKEEDALIQRIPSLKAELEERGPEILKYEARLPKSEEVPELFRDIDRFKQTSDLEIVFQTRLPPVDKQGYVELPIRLEVEGDFDAIGTFINQLERNQRFVQVKELEISETPTDRSQDLEDPSTFKTHEAVMVVSTFMFKDRVEEDDTENKETN